MYLMIFHTGMEMKWFMNDTDYTDILKQNVQIIIQLETQLHTLIGFLDLGMSSVYNHDETIKIASTLSDTLGQMDSDLMSIINMLNILYE